MRPRNAHWLARSLVLLSASLVIAVACGGPQDQANENGSCLRSEDCKPGLACVPSADGSQHVCSANLAGIVSEVDGAPMEAAAMGGAAGADGAAMSGAGGTAAGAGGAGMAGSAGTAGAAAGGVSGSSAGNTGSSGSSAGTSASGAAGTGGNSAGAGGSSTSGSGGQAGV
jgi:hypothetical protein